MSAPQVNLRTLVKGYVPSKNNFLFERRLNDYLFGIIQDHSKGRPTLVFCRWAKAATLGSPMQWPVCTCLRRHDGQHERILVCGCFAAKLSLLPSWLL